MAKQTVDALVEGGKATAAPPLGPALGPLGVNIGQVIAEINKKTADFKGMQVPVKVVVDSETKQFSVTVGTPPASSLIKKEARIEKGSGRPNTEKVADVRIEQIIKIAKMKEDALMGKTLKEKVKEVIGTCNSMGVLVEKMNPVDAIKAVNAGKFDMQIKEERTELSAEELKKLEEEKVAMMAEIARKKEAEKALAQSIVTSMAGKEKKEIRGKLKEAKISLAIINELVPEDIAPAAAGAAPAGKK